MKKINCTDTGLYKSFLDLLKNNTIFLKNAEKSFQIMYSHETTTLLIGCISSFIKSYNSYTNDEKIVNIKIVKDKLLTYDTIVRVLVDCKVFSISQASNLGMTIANIRTQLNGFEKKLS